MAFNMAWFKAQEEKKRLEEIARKKAEDPNYVDPSEQVKVGGGTENGVYYKFHKNKENNKHYFLCEELLIPHVQNTDTQRINMWSNHISQLVHLKAPEFPKVFTNFEDQVGEYSIAYRKAPNNLKIIAKIVKNEYNYLLVVQDERTGEYDVIPYQTAYNITEDYGYKLNDCIPDKNVEDTIEKDSFIYKSDNYDDDGNFAYGVNLKAVWLATYNKTYEDGVVISESAAKKLTSYKVEETMFTINGNDILLNLYGDDKTYKSFPHIGDHIDSKILVASRRKDKKSLLYDLQIGRMKEPDPATDEIIYTGGGTVMDIDVFCNVPLGELRKRADIFNQEILDIIENNQRYWREVAQALEKIIPCKELTESEKSKERSEFGHVCKHPIDKKDNPNKYTNELAYWWKISHENIDDRILWRYDGKSFDNFKIQFKILKENPLMPGAKITGRYGNKGIISEILPDDKMPVTEDGMRAEICLNPLGVIGRLNPSQLQEQYLNFMADHVLKEMKSKESYTEKSEILFDFLKLINKEEYDFFDIEYITMNRAEREKFIDDIEENGIYIHQPPFFGNTSMEQFKEIYRSHPEWCTEYKFVGIEKPMTMGDVYFVRLKHEPSNKSSMRNATNLNVKNLPAKSTLKKEKKILVSSNPLRLGEMETNNLLIAKSPYAVEKLLKTYSTNESLREQTIRQLLNPGKTEDGHLVNPLDMDLKVDLENNRAISREILDKYLNLLGYAIADGDYTDTKGE